MNFSELNKRHYIISGVLLLILLMTITGLYYIKPQSDGIEKSGEAKPTQYVCSMHPQVIRDSPGDCPICGMFLIELVAADKNSFDSSLIDLVRPVNETIHASVKTVTPEFSSLPVKIDATGIVTYDPGKVKTVSARFGGRVEKSFVKYPFQFIKKGQKIFEVYNPYVYNDRWNYVRLVQTYPERDDLTKEALGWFKLIGLSQGQVDSLKKSVIPDYYLPVYSDVEGYAVNRDFDPETYFYYSSGTDEDSSSQIPGSLNIGLNEGNIIETGEALFKLIEPGSLRIDLKVKTEYASLLEKDQKVKIKDAANPGRQYITSVKLVDPLNGGLFQTVRAYLGNEKDLIPGRRVEAEILARSREALWVPASSVINLGAHCAAFALIDNKFIAVEVLTGTYMAGKVEILSGLDESSEIAEKALLLIDSDGLINF